MKKVICLILVMHGFSTSSVRKGNVSASSSQGIYQR